VAKTLWGFSSFPQSSNISLASFFQNIYNCKLTKPMLSHDIWFEYWVMCRQLDDNSTYPALLALLHEQNLPRNMYHTTKGYNVYICSLLEEVLQIFKPQTSTIEMTRGQADNSTRFLFQHFHFPINYLSMHAPYSLTL